MRAHSRHPCSRQKITVNSQSTKILLQNILRFAPIVFLATNSSPKPYITICKLTLNSREGRQVKKRNFELNILVFQPSPIVKSLGGEFITQHKIYPCCWKSQRLQKSILLSASNRLVMLDYFKDTGWVNSCSKGVEVEYSV